MKTPQEKKDYILANIDKYVVDGRGNFYWEGAEEGLDYIYWSSLEVLDSSKIEEEMSKIIFETKEDWGLDFTEVDDFNKIPALFYKNKKDGRIMSATHIFGIYRGNSIGKIINDYKGKSKWHLWVLKLRQIITEEQTKLLEELERNEEEENQRRKEKFKKTKKNGKLVKRFLLTWFKNQSF